MYPKASMQLNKETDEEILFFTAPFLPFDNFSAHQIEIWGRMFPTVEHAFQWKKFEVSNPDVSAQIIAAKSPWAVKQISSTAANRRPDWDDVKVGIMEELLRAKVAQHEDVRNMLLESRQKNIIENSPVDDFWGIGRDGSGKNMVGVLLMKIRDEEVLL